MMKEQHHQKGGHCVWNGRYVDSGKRMIGVLPTQLNGPKVTYRISIIYKYQHMSHVTFSSAP